MSDGLACIGPVSFMVRSIENCNANSWNIITKIEGKPRSVLVVTGNTLESCRCIKAHFITQYLTYQSKKNCDWHLRLSTRVLRAKHQPSALSTEILRANQRLCRLSAKALTANHRRRTLSTTTLPANQRQCTLSTLGDAVWAGFWCFADKRALITDNTAHSSKNLHRRSLTPALYKHQRLSVPPAYSPSYCTTQTNTHTRTHREEPV